MILRGQALLRPFHRFFAVATDGRAYRRLAYLLLGLPLGTVYFALFSVGFALGIGLLIVWVGAVILLLTVLAAYALTAFERQLALRLLDADVPPLRREGAPREGWPWLASVLTGRATWKGLAFLILKFPLGLACWIVVFTLGSVSLALVLAPLAHSLGGVVDVGAWSADSLAEALLLSLGGLLLALVTLHLARGLGWLWGQASTHLLGVSSSRPAAA